jgi:hypothetical protein
MNLPGLIKFFDNPFCDYFTKKRYVMENVDSNKFLGIA